MFNDDDEDKQRGKKRKFNEITGDDEWTKQFNTKLRKIKAQEENLKQLCAGGSCPESDRQDYELLEENNELTQLRVRAQLLAQNIVTNFHALAPTPAEEEVIRNFMEGQQQLAREDRAELAQIYEASAERRATLLRTLLGGVRTSVANIILSMMFLSSLTSDSQSTLLIGDVFNNTIGNGLLSNLFILLSRNFVRPLINHNVAILQGLPEFVGSGFSNSPFIQLRAIAAIAFAGTTIYGINRTIEESSFHSIANLIRRNIPIASSIDNFGNMISSFFDYIRQDLLIPAIAEPNAVELPLPIEQQEEQDDLGSQNTEQTSSTSSTISTSSTSSADRMYEVYADIDSQDSNTINLFREMFPGSNTSSRDNTQNSEISSITVSSRESSQDRGGKRIRKWTNKRKNSRKSKKGRRTQKGKKGSRKQKSKKR